jgi:hypothetical protein
MDEHLLFNLSKSGSYPAFVTPTGTNATPVESFNIDGVRTLEIPDDTGSSTRSKVYKYQSSVNATGSLSMLAYPTGLLPLLFRSFLTDVDANLDGTAYDNDLLPDDPGSISNPQLPWFSFVQYYAGVTGQAVRGAIATKLTLACTNGEALKVSVDFLAADTGKSGGTWSDGSTAVPALPTVLYPTSMPVPFRFNEGGIYLGGTITKSGNKLSTNGSPVAVIDTFTLEITLNAEGRYPIRDGAPTIGYTRHGARDVVFSGDYDWADYTTTNYDNIRSAAETALQLRFISDPDIPSISGKKYELILSFPRMVWPQDGGLLPPVVGTVMPRKQSIRLMSMQDLGSTLIDMGVSIQTEDDLS